MIGLQPAAFRALRGRDRYQAILSIERVLSGRRPAGVAAVTPPRAQEQPPLFEEWLERERQREASRRAAGKEPASFEERAREEEEWSARLRRQLNV